MTGGTLRLGVAGASAGKGAGADAGEGAGARSKLRAAGGGVESAFTVVGEAARLGGATVAEAAFTSTLRGGWRVLALGSAELVDGTLR